VTGASFAPPQAASIRLKSTMDEMMILSVIVFVLFIQERPETRLLRQATGAGPSRQELDVFKDCTAICRMQQPL
jgi:hypothetical protein